jgi:hypothetical protein
VNEAARSGDTPSMFLVVYLRDIIKLVYSLQPGFYFAQINFATSDYYPGQTGYTDKHQ